MESTLSVREVRPLSDDIFELRLERRGLPFVPGDCLALFSADGQASRPYSIASGTDEHDLRFVIRRMPGGVVSGFLRERNPGDQVKVSPPFGWFRPGARADTSPFVFVATGTGIAPFLSHLRSRPGCPPVACLYGVRTRDEAVELAWLKERCPLRLAVSREKVEGAHHGRVTGLLDQVPGDSATDYYLCGLDAMIDEVTRFLEDRGVDIARIHRECFFNASYSS